jgi:hypothetical protein
MKEITLASGVSIMVPAPAVEDVKKTGTITTANGLVLHIGKKDIEKAEEKKGDTVMTASGIPIRITPSGEISVEQKSKASPAIKKAPPAATKKPALSAAKTPQKLNGVQSTPKKLPASGPKKIGPKPTTTKTKAPAKLATK